MKTILKYELKIKEEQWLEMPIGAKILTAQIQDDVIVLWVLVEPEFNKEDRKFLIYGTGDMITEIGLEFIATVQAGDLVWHIFERISTWY